MPAEITMPQLSDTMTEGTVVKWLKKEGDKVKEGEIIAEIETDKAVMEYESPENGTLAAVVAREGQKVPVGQAIAVVATAGEKPEEVRKQAASAPRRPQQKPRRLPRPSSTRIPMTRKRITGSWTGSACRRASTRRRWERTPSGAAAGRP